MIVQGNAHGYDNRVVRDALERFPKRFRGVAITDTRMAPAELRAWHRLGLRGLRFHLFSTAGRPGYVRGVGLDVFEAFRPVMRELGMVMQVWCDWRLMPDVAATLREISAEMPVVVDHMLNIPAERGIEDPCFQALVRLVGEGTPTQNCRRPTGCRRGFPTTPTRGRFTTRCCAPIRSGCYGAPTGRIRRSTRRSCRMMAIWSTCSMRGRRTRERGG